MPRSQPDGIPGYDNELRMLKYAASRNARAGMLYLVAVAWMYVVLMLAVTEAASPQGTALGAIVTLLGWGVVPLAIVLYILGTPARRRARKAAESAAVNPDGSGHAAGDPVAAEREEP
jgi:hypothetical protein